MYTPALYFAYGSNMNQQQMALRCPTAEPVRPLVLRNWRLVFRGVADIEPHPGSSVYGALWRILPQDEDALDRYEGLAMGLYRKVDFRVLATGQMAFMYLMNSVGYEEPGQRYYDIIEQGFRDFDHDLLPLKQAREHALLEGSNWKQDDDHMFGTHRWRA